MEAYTEQSKVYEVDGITIDLSRWTKKDQKRHHKLHRAGKDFLAVAYMVERLVIGWPFNRPITQLNYLGLGENGARCVAKALLQVIEAQKGKVR